MYTDSILHVYITLIILYTIPGNFRCNNVTRALCPLFSSSIVPSRACGQHVVHVVILLL